MGPGLGRACGCGGPGCSSSADAPGRGLGPALRSCNIGGGPLDSATRTAIERALADERRAESRYGAALEELGTFGPLSRIGSAEGRHAAALERLLEAHGSPIPPRATSAAPRFGSLAAACRDAQEIERQNIALYDELLTGTVPDDAKCVFEHLRQASKQRHLPAFESCAGAI